MLAAIVVAFLLPCRGEGARISKSLVTGIPMANVLFAGQALGLIVLPLMIFHQMQLMACAALARHYARTSLPASSRAAPLQTFTVEAR